MSRFGNPKTSSFSSKSPPTLRLASFPAPHRLAARIGGMQLRSRATPTTSSANTEKDPAAVHVPPDLAKKKGVALKASSAADAEKLPPHTSGYMGLTTRPELVAIGMGEQPAPPPCRCCAYYFREPGAALPSSSKGRVGRGVR